MHPLFRVLAVLLAGAVTALAGGKSPGAYIGIHPEGDANEGPRMVRADEIGGKRYYFRISPEVASRHFAAYTAFAAQDGASFGAVLTLNSEGRRAVDVMCSTYQGKVARIIVNGRPVDALKIDRPSADGKIVIWQGLTVADLKSMGKKLKRVGGEDPAKL